MIDIAVLDTLSLPPESQIKLQSLSRTPLNFNAIAKSESDLIQLTHNAEAILVSPWTKLTSQYFEAVPSVRYIGLCGTSTANIDLKAVKKRAIILTNIRDYGDEPTAEFIFMELVMLARGIGDYQWQSEPTELMHKPIGVIGLGALGQSITHLALSYHMDVSYYSLHRKPDWENKGARYKSLPELTRTSRIIIISSPTNVMVLDSSLFENIPPNSILVQASIGRTFDITAFKKWIVSNNNLAVFDYAAGEPLYEQLHLLPRVVFPKIIAGHSLETKQRLAEQVIKNLQAYIHQ